MSSATAQQYLVGMADLHVAKGPALFNCLGLGSCIGLLFHDVQADVAGMVHIMLPAAFEGKPVEKKGKFADTGVPELLRLMEAKGATRSRIKVAYAGGAHVFKFTNESEKGKIEIGARNITAVAEQLVKLGMRTLAHETGGNQGRTVTYDTTTGIFKVRSLVGGERTLCTIR